MPITPFSFDIFPDMAPADNFISCVYLQPFNTKVYPPQIDHKKGLIGAYHHVKNALEQWYQC